MKIMEKVIRKKLNKKKYNWLITGSSGFIGTNLVIKLLDLKQKVIGIDIKNSKIKHKNFFFIKGNLLDNKTLKKIPKNLNFVLHQASLTSVQESLEKPASYLNQNVLSYIKLVEILKTTKIKKLIYASSSAVYGDNNKINFERKLLNEKNLLSPYAISKKMIEDYSINTKTSFNKVGLRYFNVYGPHQRIEGDNLPVISNWINNILLNKNITIYGNGNSSRNYIYIDDVVNANIMSALMVNQSEILNICSQNKLSLNDLKKEILYLTKKLDINYRKFPIYKKSRYGDIRSSHGSNRLSKKKINFSEANFFKICLVKTFEWQKKYIK